MGYHWEEVVEKAWPPAQFSVEFVRWRMLTQNLVQTINLSALSLLIAGHLQQAWPRFCRHLLMALFLKVNRLLFTLCLSPRALWKRLKSALHLCSPQPLLLYIKCVLQTENE